MCVCGGGVHMCVCVCGGGGGGCGGGGGGCVRAWWDVRFVNSFFQPLRSKKYSPVSV